MRAAAQRRYGGPEHIEVRELPAPTPGPGEVLVRVRAAAIDRGTWHLMTGLPLVMRPFLGLRGPRTAVIGRDVAGVVEALGCDVTTVAVGAEVIGTARGSLAEWAVVPLSRLAGKPDSLSFAEAATLPVSGLTALQAVRAARVSEGMRVLVTGASGGVGVHAVQIAKACGATVTAVCSGAKADLVRSLGADQVIDYTREDITRTGPYDAVIDIAGNRPLSALRRELAGAGTLVIVGGEGGGRWFGGIHRQLGAMALSPFVRQRLTALASSENARDLAEVVALVERGALRPVLDRSYALEDAAKAMDHLAAGRARGKVALTPDPTPLT